MGNPNIRPGDNLVFLLDREHMTDEDLCASGDEVLVRMANEWRAGYSERFMLTVARNFQPIPNTAELNAFDSHDDSLLFPSKAALLAAMPNLVKATGGYLWLILAAKDVEDAVRKALTAYKPN